MSKYTKINLEAVEDKALSFGHGGHHEARFVSSDLKLTQSKMSYQKYYPGKRSTFGHTEGTQEEVYIFTRGSGTLRLDDEYLEVKAMDAVRIDGDVMRGVEAGPDGLDMVIYGAPWQEKFSGTMDKDWWPEEQRK